MNSRMDKYEIENHEYSKRTSRNAVLYSMNEIDDYGKFDINSNISVLKNDAKKIDVDQIRDMLDKKYRDNVPQRKSITLDFVNKGETKDPKEDTKEYDINQILSKAKTQKNVDYESERLRKINNTDMEIIKEINQKYSKKEETQEEKELLNLINTITQLEIKNNPNQDDANLLDLQDDKPEPQKQEFENSFYTGKLVVKEDDFEDFKDMQNDIKSNSILIKILIFIFIAIAIGIALIIANKYLHLGLF